MHSEQGPYEDIDLSAIRRRFPTLATETVFLENAGGSQVPAVVADAMRDYMLGSYVQLGAGYELSRRCDEVVEKAHDFVNQMMGGQETGKAILGSSCTQLMSMLAGCYAKILAAGDEIIVTETGHEANVGPWIKLADRGFTVKTWRVDPESLVCPLEGLKSLLTERTRLVAVVHVSNLLGEIVDVAEIAKLVHEAGARIVVDGVAYAPHRAMDVGAWDVDWYAYSTYKVYGPHMGALYGKREAMAELTGPNHFFIPADELPYKFEPGGPSHEGCAGLLALAEYLKFLAAQAGAPLDESSPVDRETILRAYDVMTLCELPLQEYLIDYLWGKPQYRIVGPPHAEESRVGTISLVHESKKSADLAAAAHAVNIGVRNGHMYAYRFCEAIGLEPEDGVLRASMLHYNTLAEIDRLIAVLDAQA